jgi:hypothetical protein
MLFQQDEFTVMHIFDKTRYKYKHYSPIIYYFLYVNFM